MQQKQITSFKNQYRFLSNFWPADIYFEGEYYPSVEHAYQAAKTIDFQKRLQFQDKDITAAQAKKLAKKLKIRNDWEEIKLYVMRDLVAQKFSEQNWDLKDLLLSTGDAILIEGNTWGDTFWGVCNGEGQNHLGKILMNRRAELQANVHEEIY